MITPPSRRVRTAFALWVGVILLIVLPWTGFRAHSHWDGVEWVPFLTFPKRLPDIIANTLFYVPFGVLYVRTFRSRIWKATLAALVLSLVTELAQVYSHGRFPSSTDIVSNTLGACCGAVWAASRGSGRT